MERTWNNVEVRECYDIIWKFWRNKDRASAAHKAVQHFLRTSGLPFETLKLACEIYTLETQGDNFTYQLGNFIHEGHLEDTLQGAKNPEEYKAKLDQTQADAIEVIASWNHNCRAHWFKTFDETARIPTALKALQDNYFQTHWKIALDKAAKIFQYRLRESDPRSRIKLNLRWFCDTSPDKHTVLKILEGDYGSPESDVVGEKAARKERPDLTEEDREQIAKDWLEVFGKPLGNNDAPIDGGDDSDKTKEEGFDLF